MEVTGKLFLIFLINGKVIVIKQAPRQLTFINRLTGGLNIRKYKSLMKRFTL